MKNEISPSEPILAEALDWQKPLVQELLELKQRQRLPHALMIELNTAVDSRAFGWYLASALLCQAPLVDSPCGRCPSCSLMQANSYPDFSFATLEVDDKTHKLNKVIKIQQIRKLIYRMTLTNNLQGGKIALLYPAEKLNQAAANSLLKTLEEPSADSILILLTHNAGRLPITIRSRCQRWVLQNPAHGIASSWLQQQGLQSAQLDACLELAHNDAQLALELHRQGFIQQLDEFSELLQKYLSDRIDVVSLVKQLKVSDSRKLSLILKTEIQRRMVGLLSNKPDPALKQSLRGLLDLTKKIDRVLQVEDNNLNLLLQLEDVLISLKQIINS